MTREPGGPSVTAGPGVAAILGGLVHVAVPLGPTVAIQYGYPVLDHVTLETYAVAGTVRMLLLAAGTVGLYYRHRDAFGWAGQIGVALILFGFLIGALENASLVVTGDPVVRTALGGGFVDPGLPGAVLLGAAIALADDLPHALIGGLLLALGRLVSFGLAVVVLASVDLFEGAVLAVAVLAIPYGAAWAILGHDLLTEPDRSETPG